MHKTLTTTALATLLALGATAASAEIRIGASVSATGPAATLRTLSRNTQSKYSRTV